MANSKLLNKIFYLPDKLLMVLQRNLDKYSSNATNKGYKRCEYLLENKSCTYQELKRIKAYFDSLNDDNFDEIEYYLNGGKLMYEWVEFMLDQARKYIKSTQTARSNAGLENQFRQSPNENPSYKDAMPSQIRTYPEIMTNNALLKEEIDKIKTIIIKIN